MAVDLKVWAQEGLMIFRRVVWVEEWGAGWVCMGEMEGMARWGRRILAAGRAWAIGEAEGCQVEDPRQQLQPCERWWPVARRRRGSRPR